MEFGIDIICEATEHARKMPAQATRMVALPFPFAISLPSVFHEQLFASNPGSASILLALAGILPASVKGLRQLVATR